MIINHNLSALNTYRKQQQNAGQAVESIKKLSAGMRITQAADDSAGLAISEKMRGQIRGIEKAKQNVTNGISLAQTADSALGNINDPILQRLRELAVQAANDVLTDSDRQQIQLEVAQLKESINQIANETEFNTIPLLNRTSGIGGASDVIVVDGSEKQLTSTLDYDTHPSWKGDFIAFQRGSHIFVMDPDGSNQKQLIKDAAQPAISEDGKYIAYVKDNNLFIADIAGNNSKQITADSSLQSDITFGSRLAWSANSDTIYFQTANGIEAVNTADNTRTVLVAEAGARSASITPNGSHLIYEKSDGIFSLNIATSDIVQLSKDGTGPRVSPDGKLIAFSAFPEQSGSGNTSSMSDQIFVMNIDGSGRTDITSSMSTADQHEHNIFPEWSPDGTHIIYHSDNLKDPRTSGDIWSVQLGGISLPGSNLFAGNTMTLQVGANSGQDMKIMLSDVRTSALGLHSLKMTTRKEADQAIALIDRAMQKVSSERSKYGSYQNALEHIDKNLSNYQENITASESRIRDLDMAKEITNLSKSQIILQSSQAMTAQANQVTQGILQLLK